MVFKPVRVYNEDCSILLEFSLVEGDMKPIMAVNAPEMTWLIKITHEKPCAVRTVKAILRMPWAMRDMEGKSKMIP